MTTILKELKTDDSTIILYDDNSKTGFYQQTARSRRRFRKEVFTENLLMIIVFFASIATVLSFLVIMLPWMINDPSSFLDDPALGWGSDLAGLGWLALFHTFSSFVALFFGAMSHEALFLFSQKKMRIWEVGDHGSKGFFEHIHHSSEKLISYLETMSGEKLLVFINHCKNYKENSVLIEEIEKTLNQDSSTENSSTKTHHLRKDLMKKLESLKKEQKKNIVISQQYEQKVEEYAESLRERELSEKYLTLLAS